MPLRGVAVGSREGVASLPVVALPMAGFLYVFVFSRRRTDAGRGIPSGTVAVSFENGVPCLPVGSPFGWVFSLDDDSYGHGEDGRRPDVVASLPAWLLLVSEEEICLPVGLPFG